MLSHSIKKISLNPFRFIVQEILDIKYKPFSFKGSSQKSSAIDHLNSTRNSLFKDLSTHPPNPPLGSGDVRNVGGTGFTPPRIGEPVRSWGLHLGSNWRGLGGLWPEICVSPVFDTLCIDSTIGAIKKQGFALGINLPQDVVREIWNLAMHNPFYSNEKMSIGFYYADKKQAQSTQSKPLEKGIYDQTALVYPVIKNLERDPKLLEIATQYLKAEPIHLESKLWWNFAVDSNLYERRRAAQRFHHDVKNSRCLKFLFYLTDVDLCSSPHVCIQGSHVKKKLSHRLFKQECSSQEISDYYGYQNIIPICGKAGFGFVEDGRCFHKITSPSSTDRLTLEVTYKTF